MPNFMTDEEMEAENAESRPDGRGLPRAPTPPQRPMTPEEAGRYFPEGGLGRELADAGLVTVDAADGLYALANEQDFIWLPKETAT